MSDVSKETLKKEIAGNYYVLHHHCPTVSYSAYVICVCLSFGFSCEHHSCPVKTVRSYDDARPSRRRLGSFKSSISGPFPHVSFQPLFTGRQSLILFSFWTIVSPIPNAKRSRPAPGRRANGVAGVSIFRFSGPLVRPLERSFDAYSFFSGNFPSASFGAGNKLLL